MKIECLTYTLFNFSLLPLLLIISEMFIDVDRSPPVVTSGHLTWLGRIHMYLCQVSQLMMQIRSEPEPCGGGCMAVPRLRSGEGYTNAVALKILSGRSRALPGISLSLTLSSQGRKAFLRGVGRTVFLTPCYLYVQYKHTNCRLHSRKAPHCFFAF